MNKLLNSFENVCNTISAQEGYNFYTASYLALGKGSNAERVFGKLKVSGNDFCRVFIISHPYLQAVVVEATPLLVPTIVYGGDFVDSSTTSHHKTYIKVIR